MTKLTNLKKNTMCKLIAQLLFVYTFSCVGGSRSMFRGNTASTRGGQRPTPSHDLPVIDLIEPPDKMYDPKPGDLDPIILKDKMGKNFDSRFMSIQKPLDSIFAPNGTIDFNYERNKKGMLIPVGKMPKSVRKLKFKFLYLPNGRQIRTKVTQRLRKKLRQFLWAYTYCPVVYIWKDLGLRFWPRWLREGHCHSAQSCSFPEGMACKPSKSLTKLVLRWHCQDWDRAKYCKWIPVSYPLITRCSCTC